MAFVINAETVRFAGYRTIIKLSNWQEGGAGGEGGGNMHLIKLSER